MGITAVILEDDGYSGFGPLTDLRAVWDMRAGVFKLGERLIEQVKPEIVFYFGREEIMSLHAKCERLSPQTLKDFRDDILFLNGRASLADAEVQKLINGSDSTYTSNGQFVAAKTSNVALGKIDNPSPMKLIELLMSLETKKIEAEIYSYPWELLQGAANLLNEDIQSRKFENSVSVPKDIQVRGAQNLMIADSARLGLGIVIDATGFPVVVEPDAEISSGVIVEAKDGPVWIAPDAKVEAGAILMGPVYIGSHSIVRPGARVSDGVFLGPHCRIGGEVSSSIMQGYSSKQHSGYLGNCYVGEWVNLGAATDNSDLKNNYRPIRVNIGGELVDTGSLHIGVVIGDYVRSAIHTRQNSGAVVGTCCNLFGSAFPDKDVPPFIWFGDDGYQEYKLDKALDTIRVVMPRRDRELTSEIVNRLRQIFEDSADERQQFLLRVNN